MPPAPLTARRAQVLESCRQAVAGCDEATLARLGHLLDTIAGGASLEGYSLSACPSHPLPDRAARLLALLDPAMGQA